MPGRPRVAITPDGYLSPAEFARRIGLSYSKVLRMVREGRIDALREGQRMIFIHESQLQRVREQQAAPQPKPAPLPATKRPRGPR